MKGMIAFRCRHCDAKISAKYPSARERAVSTKCPACRHVNLLLFTKDSFGKVHVLPGRIELRTAGSVL
ncbi:MAG: hypothetical protein KJ579_02500 [Verrucomicrobia bacterium]|nr:hypothetical protein [Verrucomicrobiota bacterium]